MHVHGAHLNVSVPIDIGATGKSAASQRAAEVRKKLLKNGKFEVDSDFYGVEASSLDEEGGGEGSSREQNDTEMSWKSGGSLETEDSTDAHTSFWI